eukprot:7180350-Prymnesium_polylepis.1
MGHARCRRGSDVLRCVQKTSRVPHAYKARRPVSPQLGCRASITRRTPATQIHYICGCPIWDFLCVSAP